MKLETAKRISDGASHERVSHLAVAVLMGGASSEREVSLNSGVAILRALAPEDGSDRRGPASVHGIEIDTSGMWRTNGERLEPGAALDRLPRDAVFFLGLHGGDGEDGTVQGLLAAHGRLFTGSGVAASALCMNKHATRLVLRDAGVAIAPGCTLTRRAWHDRREQSRREALAVSTVGWVVKPNGGGSSVATTIVDHAGALDAAIERALQVDERVLVEARVVGTEVTCGVVGNSSGALQSSGTVQALPVVEIVPRRAVFFDYREKYSSDGADENCPPRLVTAESCARVQELATLAHRTAGCDGYSRTDFIVPRDADGREGEPVALEINTLPGMTDRSLLPRAAVARGWSLRDLCLEILALAVARDADRRRSATAESVS